MKPCSVSCMGHQRRGAALILVLAAIIVILTAIVAALRVQGEARLQVHGDAIERRAQVLCADTEPAIALWLSSHAQDLVVSLDAESPFTAIIDRQVDAAPGHDGLRLRVHLADALSGIPAHLAKKGARLSGALPEAWQGLRLPTDLQRPEQLQAHRLVDRLRLPAPHLQRYPTFTERQLSPAKSLVGAVSFWSDGRINVNTAPLALIERSARLLKKSVPIEEISAARIAGRPFALQGFAQGQDGADERNGLQLTDTSDRFLVRIDLQLGAHAFAWWQVWSADAGAPQRIMNHALGPY